jgi:shikimate dehydrogenase
VLGASTRICAVIGWPIKHSRSPAMHNAAFAALGLDFAYVALPVAPARLAEAIAGAGALGIRGLNVTIPHKEGVLALVDADEEARRVGAVNTVVYDEGAPRPRGHNTDVAGVTVALDELGAAPTGRAVILGTGGAARAVVVALRARGASAIAAVSRSPGAFVVDGAPVATHGYAALPSLLATAELLVDATPRGLDPTAPLPDLAPLPPSARVLDLVVARSTALVDAARARGLRAEPGAAMLLHQGAAAFTHFTGQAAPVDVMRRALLASL